MARKSNMKYRAEEKKRNIIILSAILFIIGLILVIVGTYAYYSSNIHGTISGTIATWSFKVNGSNPSFTTITLSPTQTGNTLNNKVAPGTSGSFDLVLNSTGSDLDIDYTVTFGSFTNIPTNLKFYEDSSFTTELDLTSNLFAINDTLLKNSTETITIYWRWPYGDSTSVSADNNDANKTVSFVASIVGVQDNS